MYPQANKRQRKGAAAVEMALVLPLFFLIILGIVEFGRAFMVQHMLANAARTASRQAIIEGSSETEIEANTKQLCEDTIGIPGSNFTVQIVSGDGSGYLSDAGAGDICTVTVDVPFQAVSFIPGSFIGNYDLSAACSMEHE